MADVGSGEAQEVAGTPRRHHLPPTRKWGSCRLSPALCSDLSPGMLPQSSPMSGLALFFQEASPDHALPLLLGNSHSPCAPPWTLASATLFLVWVQGTHLHRYHPLQGSAFISHCSETRCSGGPTQARGTSSLPMLQLGVLCLQHQG